MKIKLFAGVAAVAALAVAGSANAVVISHSVGMGLIDGSQSLITDFNVTGGTVSAAPSAIVSGGTLDIASGYTFVQDPGGLSYVRDGSAGLNSGVSAPPPGDPTYYESVQATNGVAKLESDRGLTSFSFYLGSPDTYNYLTFKFKNGSSLVLQGAQIWGAVLGNGDSGDQGVGYRINYDFGKSTVTEIEFKNNTPNAFEFDSLYGSAAPEPATWAMMIFGFGAAGYALRNRRRQAFA